MPTLKEALDTIAEYCRRTKCEDCEFAEHGRTTKDRLFHWCMLNQESPEDYDKIQIVETNMYDKRTIIKNAIVEILENTKTGETSIGWYENK